MKLLPEIQLEKLVRLHGLSLIILSVQEFILGNYLQKNSKKQNIKTSQRQNDITDSERCLFIFFNLLFTEICSSP